MRKENKTYYFSVEGETEKWYLEWLQDEINRCKTAKNSVKIISQVTSSPVSYVKRMNILKKTEVTHIFDFESAEPEYEKRFKGVLGEMKTAQTLGRNVKYRLGYSNLTFELWVILHKADCNGSLSDRKQYLSKINKAYGEEFEKLSDYKRETDFKRILGKLQLEDVFRAIERARRIQQKNLEDGNRLMRDYGFEYYRENPSLSIWEPVEKILLDCGIEPDDLL